MTRRRFSSMAPGFSRLVSFLVGMLVGMFFVALVKSGSLMPLNALSFVSLLLAVLIVVRLVAGDVIVLLVGLIVGAVLVLLIPALSPAGLSSDQLMLALIVLILALRM